VRLLAATLAGLCLLPGMLVTHGQDPSTQSGSSSTDALIGPVNWPQFRFNDKHTGLNTSEKILTRKSVRRLQLAWQAQLGKLVDYSSPAVVNGVVYIGTVDGRLWAYPDTGCGSSFCTQPLWSSVGLGQIVDSPAVSNGIVYVGSQTSDDSNDGRLNAFSASGCGQPVCAPLWQGLAGTESILQSSPAVSKGLVFVGAYDGRIYAFNAAGCGAPECPPVWRGQTGGTIESTPTIVNGVAYIGSDDGKLYAFTAAGCGALDCRPLWTGRIGGPVYDSTPAFSGGVLYIGSPHALSAFSAAGCGSATCQPLWQAVDTLNFFNGSPAVFNGRVYIGLENGVGVYSASGCGAPTCGPLWTYFGEGAQAAVLSSPAIAHGVVYAGRNTGDVLAWSAAGCGSPVCDAIWIGRTNDVIVNSSPTVVNGRLYIGSADRFAPESIQGRLYVFALP
jgi:outer membrane protein assembly factor BamB